MGRSGTCSRINQSPASLGPVSNAEGADGERPQAAGSDSMNLPHTGLQAEAPGQSCGGFTLGPQVADRGFSLPA